MNTTNKQVPRIEYWKNAQGKFNYRIIGKNGRKLVSVNQGFERSGDEAGTQGMTHNIKAVAEALTGQPWIWKNQLQVLEIAPPKGKKKDKE